MTIRLDPGDGPIHGVLVAKDERRVFSGWLELAGLIEGLRPAGSEARREDAGDTAAPAR